MDLATLAAGMRARMPWDVGKLALEQIGLPKGHGWDATVSKLNELEIKKGDLALPQLIETLKQHTICGEKLTAMYKVSSSTKQKLRATLLEQTIPQGKFAKAYPGILDEAVLADTAAGKLHLVALEESDEGLAAVFTSVRFIEAREKLIPSALPAHLADALSEYNELVGVKHVKMQPMDVVWIPKKGNYIDLRVDMPRGVPEELGKAAHKHLRDHIAGICGEQHLKEPVNFFPLIQEIYGTDDEGRIVEMAFGTTTASLKHERMRRKQLCLRKETYHKGGKTALKTPLEMFRLSVEWDAPASGATNSTPEVSFNGGARMAAGANPTLQELVVSKCLGYLDYGFIRDKIESYLEKVIANQATK